MAADAKQLGDLLEDIVAERVEGDLQPGSGNKWFAKLDVEGTEVLLSCKATKNQTRTTSTSELREMEDSSFETGQIPALVEGLGGDLATGTFERITITFDLEDFLEYMTERQRIELTRGARAETVREAASVPQLLRDDEEKESEVIPTPNSASPEVSE